MSFDTSLRFVRQAVDEAVSVSVGSVDGYQRSGDAEALKAHTKLSSLSATETTVRIYGDESETVYARGRFVRFHTEPVGLISWVEVHEAIQGRGVGRALREDILAELDGCESVYSKIINPKLFSVAIDQGFRQIQHGDLEGWFVRE